LANHFGNDGKNIRKFRQIIREAWDKHVSAVYPQAKAEFDTGLIRLHSSPAPVPRKTLLSVITPTGERDGVRMKHNGPTAVKANQNATLPNLEDMSPNEALKARFFDALSKRIGVADMKSWFSTSRLTAPADGDPNDDQWILIIPNKFQAKWVADNFIQALEFAGKQAGLAQSPQIQEG
jgi:hypothetical protein